MLSAIGVKNLDDLFADVPPSVILKKGLNLPPGLTEPELKRFFNMIGKNNQPVSDRPCFLGAGSLLPRGSLRREGRGDPARIFDLLYALPTGDRPGHPPGSLRFPNLHGPIDGLEVSNASLYDGATAVAEAALLALRVKKAESFVYVSRGLHPEYRQTIQTYLNPQGHKIREIGLKGTETDLEPA